jgi:RNA-binding protein Musashi
MNFDDRDDRGFRDRGSRFDNAGGNAYNLNANNAAQSAAYNGLTPQMMAQYWQSMQRYMQTMMGRGGGPMPAVNPAMMQQAMANMPGMAGMAGMTGMTGMAGMNPQMMQQMSMQAQMMRQQGGSQSPPNQNAPMVVGQGYGGGAQGTGYGSQQSYDGVGAYAEQSAGNQYRQQQQQQQQQQQRYQSHPSQRDYAPPQSHPSSWEGMYDDVPPQQVVQQMQQQQQQPRQGISPNFFSRFLIADLIFRYT